MPSRTIRKNIELRKKKRKTLSKFVHPLRVFRFSFPWYGRNRCCAYVERCPPPPCADHVWKTRGIVPITVVRRFRRNTRTRILKIASSGLFVVSPAVVGSWHPTEIPGRPLLPRKSEKSSSYARAVFLRGRVVPSHPDHCSTCFQLCRAAHALWHPSGENDKRPRPNVWTA